jgi:hypothetical protein
MTDGEAGATRLTNDPLGLAPDQIDFLAVLATAPSPFGIS